MSLQACIKERLRIELTEGTEVVLDNSHKAFIAGLCAKCYILAEKCLRVYTGLGVLKVRVAMAKALCSVQSDDGLED